VSAVDRSQSFILEDLRVLSVTSNSANQEDELVVWAARYYETDPSVSSENTRVLIANLHFHASDGFGTVAVGGLITPTPAVPSDASNEVLSALIAESAALESLYDLARVNARVVAAITDVEIDLPYKSPDATVEFSDSSATGDDEAEHERARDASSEISEQTVTALKNYDYLLRSKGLDDVSLHWDINTLVWGDGGSLIDETLTVPGFTPATRD